MLDVSDTAFQNLESGYLLARCYCFCISLLCHDITGMKVMVRKKEGLLGRPKNRGKDIAITEIYIDTIDGAGVNLDSWIG